MNYKFKKSLGSDNHSGVHPEILRALMAINHSHSHSYGSDEVTKKSQKLFKEIVHPEAQSLLVFNGTAANVLSLRPLLKPFQSVLCTDISHLNVDECGAPESALGTKLISIPSVDGKIDLTEASKYCIRKGDQHYSQPKVLSITQPTEVGTCYSLDELGDIRDFCEKHQLDLHIDGARISYAPHYLKCSFKEMIDIAKPKTISFGGTKNGLLYGEAVLFFGIDITEMKFHRKQLMQLPSKMRFMASQFITFFENDLYKTIPEHGHKMAKYMEKLLKDEQLLDIAYPVQANSVFPKIPKSWTKPLKEESFFYIWDENDWVVRWMCSFDTGKEEIENFVQKIRSLKNSD
tara:strand:- start:40376 stop:41416 length:1041 start_codon:yes stop_codon:yes gene_type:complete